MSISIGSERSRGPVGQGSLGQGPLAKRPLAKAGALIGLVERGMLGLQMTLAMLATGLLLLAVLWQMIFPEQRTLSDLVAGVAALLVAIPVLASAWDSLRHPSLHGVTDRLISVALIAAWASGDLMTAAVLPIIMILGHVLEERSLLGSREAIQALSRLTETQTRRLVAGGGVEVVASAALMVGDRIELLPGSRVPADGVIRTGEAGLDMASLTGESVPVDVGPGDAALAGSINTNGRLELEVTRLGAETTLGKIIGLMRTAERAKPPVARLLERYAGHYMALVLLIAAGTWFASGDTPATLAVLVASCPCALVLAAPATSIAAISVAARHGILIKGAAFLEQLAEVNAVVFDKTGTLTTGELALIDIRAVDGADVGMALRLAAALGGVSNHPVSRAAARGMAEMAAGRIAVSTAVKAELPILTLVREVGGSGVTAMTGEGAAILGRPELFAGAVAPRGHDGPIAGVGLDGTLLAWLLFADQKRPESRAAVEELRALGLERQVLLTGDREAVAQRIGAELGIADVAAEALPEAKMQRVMAEIGAGYRPLVVGDGINDSLALKVGAVGVAMGAAGTDVALASADLVLMTSDLRRLATAIRLSRRCRQTIHANVAIGLGWTLLLVGLAAGGVLGAEGAIIAALLHNLSTFAGLGNAGRLLLFDELRLATSGRVG